ncbi:MAG: sigma-E factor negative regulatory protein [Burkholderiaceae bacterium]|nr:sigma-E factor negative regulatory protein [Burkholderiaceae bacterium]
MNDSELPRGSDEASLSALMDGELDDPQVAAACAAWRRDARQQARWHAYHLVGDVLRSDELARPPERDEAFLAALRSRLEREPVVLAPTQRSDMPAPPLPLPGVATGTDGSAVASVVKWPSSPPARVRRVRWAAPVGIAAGVMMVAGVVWSLRGEAPSSLAAWGPTAPAASTPPAGAVDARQALAEAELERYLRAHREFQGSAALSPAAGFVRNAAYEVGSRP